MIFLLDRHEKNLIHRHRTVKVAAFVQEQVGIAKVVVEVGR
jgi:hypothetical protein